MSKGHDDLEFKVGDVVQLRSGGPRLTVADLAEMGDGLSIQCHWFSGSRLDWGRFSPIELVLIERAELDA